MTRGLFGRYPDIVDAETNGGRWVPIGAVVHNRATLELEAEDVREMVSNRLRRRREAALDRATPSSGKAGT